MKKSGIWEDKMKPMSEQKVCATCGAPAISELCSYCGMPTGLDTKEVTSEYPTIECNPASLKDAKLAGYVAFGLIFAPCGLALLFAPVRGADAFITKLAALPFLGIGIGFLVPAAKRVISYVKVKLKGKRISGTVYGYVYSPWIVNGERTYVAKILIETPGGPRFILYDLGKNYKPYSINEPIALLAYKNNYLIAKKYYFE